MPVRQFAGERYFTVVRDAPGRGWWLLSRRARALFLRWSSDGLEFSNRKLVLEGDAACNAAALQVQGIALVALRAIAARNPLVVTNGTAFRGDGTHVLVVGGKSGDGSFAPHRRDGVRGAVAFDLDPGGGALREALTKPLFQGNGNGCVEGRGAAPGKHDFRGWCEFDGRFSLVYWRDASVLYTRANVWWGTRSVQMTRSSDLETWDPWRLIDIDGSSPDADRNIYFFGVSANPADADSLIAVLPINHPRAGLSARRHAVVAARAAPRDKTNRPADRGPPSDRHFPRRRRRARVRPDQRPGHRHAGRLSAPSVCYSFRSLQGDIDSGAAGLAYAASSLSQAEFCPPG